MKRQRWCRWCQYANTLTALTGYHCTLKSNFCLRPPNHDLNWSVRVCSKNFALRIWLKMKFRVWSQLAWIWCHTKRHRKLSWTGFRRISFLKTKNFCKSVLKSIISEANLQASINDRNFFHQSVFSDTIKTGDNLRNALNSDDGFSTLCWKSANAVNQTQSPLIRNH